MKNTHQISLTLINNEVFFKKMSRFYCVTFSTLTTICSDILLLTTQPVVGHGKEYPTMWYFGIPQAYLVKAEITGACMKGMTQCISGNSSQKLHRGFAVSMPFCW